MFLGLAGTVFLLGRLSKLLLVNTISPGERVPVIGRGHCPDPILCGSLFWGMA